MSDDLFKKSNLRINAPNPDGWRFDHWTPANPEVSGHNGLSRTNFFNGRYLDAEAFERDQNWVGKRDKLVAQTEHAGIAWGLGLRYPRGGRRQPPVEDPKEPRNPKEILAELEALLEAGRITEEEYRERLRRLDERLHGQPAEGDQTPIPAHRPVGPQFGLDSDVRLEPGLAFDSEGRPIKVDAEFDFTFAELLDEYANNPRVAVPPKTRFHPCVCIESVPGARDAGPNPESGAYILVISPAEFPSDRNARVHRDICKKADRVACEADAWRGGFQLSLVKFPAPSPSLVDAWSIFALRGEMAAYYFDTWERRWESRWSRPFMEDDRFCRALGPLERNPGAVPLAFVYIGTSNDVMFVDPWIPRRYQISSASRAWEALLRGAPTPATSQARRHQFQCQLQETLHSLRDDSAESSLRLLNGRKIKQPEHQINAAHRPNLYQLGFRHIPPCGFLPVDIDPRQLQDRQRFNPDDPLGHHLITHSALRQGRQYFAGTNVFTRSRVAVYEDDIFEEMQRVREKDPIRLREFNLALWRCIDNAFNPISELLRRTKYAAGFTKSQSRAGYTDWSAIELRENPSSMVGVFVVYLLRHLMRCLPVSDEALTLDAIANHEIELVELIAPLYGRDFVGERMSADYRRLAKLYQERGIASEHYEPALDAPRTAPRHFVFYVKKRMVFGELIYLLISTILHFIDALRLPQQGLTAVSAEALAQGGHTPNMLVEILESDAVIDSMVEETLSVHPEMRAHATLKAYEVEFDRFREELLERGLDEQAALRSARGRAIDAMLHEYEGFDAYKNLILLSGGAVDKLHERLVERASDAPRTEAHARTMVERAFYFDGYRPGVNDAAADAITEARRHFGESLVEESEEPMRYEDLLHRRGVELGQLFGEEAGAKLERRIRDKGRKLVRAINAAAENKRLATVSFWKRWHKALGEHTSASAALEHLAREEQDEELVENLRAVDAELGDEGLMRVMNSLEGLSR